MFLRPDRNSVLSLGIGGLDRRWKLRPSRLRFIPPPLRPLEGISTPRRNLWGGRFSAGGLLARVATYLLPLELRRLIRMLIPCRLEMVADRRAFGQRLFFYGDITSDLIF